MRADQSAQTGWSGGGPLKRQELKQETEGEYTAAAQNSVS